jgi:hypothetical protein
MARSNRSAAACYLRCITTFDPALKAQALHRRAFIGKRGPADAGWDFGRSG